MSEATSQPAREERDARTIYTPDEARGVAPARGRLPGRRILVVGAGSLACDDPDHPVGNGRATAILAAREGATVACADKSEAAAEETRRSIEREGGTASVLVADVVDERACDEVVQAAHSAMQGLDGVVINVGTGLGRGLAGTAAAAWDTTFAVNLRSHFLIARAALPRLDAGGSIIFVGSVAGLRPGSGLPAYDASKAGLYGLCRHVALEGAARGVRANLLVPGLIDTPLGRAANRGRPSRAGTQIPLGRQGTGFEVAHAALFLLSAESSYVTGQALVVDGGLSSLR